MLGWRVGYQMKRAEHALRLEMDDALRGLGLTTPQYAALSVLAEGPGLSGAEVARRCFVTPQTINGVLVKLEGAGLVSRRAHARRGRVLQAYLTAEGEGLLARAHRAVAEIEERMLSGLGQEDRVRLLEASKGCAESLGAGERGRRDKALRQTSPITAGSVGFLMMSGGYGPGYPHRGPSSVRCKRFDTA